ncbi:MAG TPA: GNAT family N-acetyltransferase [Ktedonobacterales bacterium]|nr:GNAT family N-acetyltransferase [Ktedonobacterales bacterium]
MAEPFRFGNALGYTFAQLAEMHNESFSGYFVPFTMTPESVAVFWRDSHIDARVCVVMESEAGEFAGMARMGVRGDRAWCGGFGITPAFRGMGASHQLAAQMVAVARQFGLSSLQLEVLTQNAAAITVYERVGLVKERRLAGLQIDTSALQPDPNLSPTPASSDTLLPILAQQGRLDWRREPASILATSTQIATVSDGKATGSIVYARNSDRLQILAVRLDDAITPAAFGASLAALAGTTPQITIPNEPEDTHLYRLCLSIGFAPFYTQFEMAMTL